MKITLLLGLLLVVSHCQFITSESQPKLTSQFLDYTNVIVPTDQLQRIKICDLTATKKQLQAVVKQIVSLNQKISTLANNQILLKNQIATLSSASKQTPIKFQMGSNILAYQSGHGLDIGTGPRQKVMKVKFATPFNQLPKVSASLSQFDMNNNIGLRLRVIVRNVTVEGFDIVYISWSSSIVNSAETQWIAIGK